VNNLIKSSTFVSSVKHFIYIPNIKLQFFKDVIELPQVVVIDEEDNGEELEQEKEESNENVDLAQENEPQPQPVQVAIIPPPAEASTMAKSPVGDQPTAAGQLIAHRIHDADDDVPIPRDDMVREEFKFYFNNKK
jgi:hypothetical protein